MRLYDLTEQHIELLEMLDLDPENEALIAMIEGMDGKIEEKIENLIIIRHNEIEDAEMLDKEIKRLTARKQQIEKKADRLKWLVENTMTRLGKDKIRSFRFDIRMQANNPRVEIIDQSLIPICFMDYPDPVPPRLDKKAVLEEAKRLAQMLSLQVAGGEPIEVKVTDVAIPGIAIKQDKSLRVR